MSPTEPRPAPLPVVITPPEQAGSPRGDCEDLRNGAPAPRFSELALLRWEALLGRQ